MKKLPVIILSTLVLGLGVLCLAQWQALRRQAERTRVAELAWREEIRSREALSSRAEEAEGRAKRLEREVQEFSAVTSNLRANDSVQRSNLTTLVARAKTAGPGGTGADNGISGQEMGDMLSKMMKDPEMRKMVQSQQKAAVEMMYAGLFKQMRLTPEEKTAFQEVLLDAQMRRVEGAQDLFSGSESGQDPAAARRTFEQAKQETDARVKELLGEERYAEYQDYQKNIGERMQVDKLQSRLESENMPLQGQQVSQLLQIMQDEKKRVPQVFPDNAENNPALLKSMMTADNIEKQIQWMEDYNKRILEQAGAVLSPEQLKLLRESQEQQLAMQKLGLKMAKGMFGPKGGATPAQ